MSDDDPRAAPPEAPPPTSGAPGSDPGAEKPSETGAEKPPDAEAAPRGEPVSQKRKRKRKREKVEEPALRNSLRPDGRERPAFLLGFPEDPALERLIRAFELGDYATVRKGATELAERTTDLKVRAAAEELARRIEPDPLVKLLLGLSVVLLVALTLWAYKTHGG